MKAKIIIIVEGGIVQSVHANMDADIIIADYDRKADDPDEEVIVSEILSPDTVFDSGQAAADVFGHGVTDKNDKKVVEFLTEKQF